MLGELLAVTGRQAGRPLWGFLVKLHHGSAYASGGARAPQIPQEKTSSLDSRDPPEVTQVPKLWGSINDPSECGRSRTTHHLSVSLRRTGGEVSVLPARLPPPHDARGPW